MTKAQEKMVNKIKYMMEQEFFYDKEKYEVKQFDVNDDKYFVSVVGEVGLKGDEGTLAQVFGRERFHLFIGKKVESLTTIEKEQQNTLRDMKVS